MSTLRIILMILALIALPTQAKDLSRLPTTSIRPTKVPAKTVVPASATTSANLASGRSGSGAIHEPEGALNGCAQSFLAPEPYSWYSYRNVCPYTIHITFKPKTASLKYSASAMDLAPGQSSSTGYSTIDAPKGLLEGVCHKDFVPVDAQNKMWEAIEGVSFRCMKVSGTSPRASEATLPQKKPDDQMSPSKKSAQVQDQQKIDALNEPERVVRVEQERRQAEKLQQQDAGRQPREANAGNGDNATVIAGKSFTPQPASNSYEIEKIGKGFVVALDCSKNVKGALQVVAEIGDPPNAVVFKNVSSSDIFLVAGARRVDGYGSEALVLQSGKEHKIVQLKVDRNYNYGEWYAVYTDKITTQPVEQNSKMPSADLMQCLNRVNEIIKSFR